MSRPEHDSTAAAESSLAGPGRRATSDRAYLVLCHPGPRRVWPLAGRRAVLGRAGGTADLHVDDGRASRDHVALAHGPDGWTATDLGSRNGTRIDGQRAPAGQAVRLRPGAVVRVGDSLLVFREGPPPDEAEHPLLPGVAPGVARARRDLAAAVGDGGHVLLLGETGTGKDYAARYLHAQLGAQGPWVPVNCAEIAGELARPELFGNTAEAWTKAVARQGLVARASGGVLFLDEIGDLDLRVQAELLRFLEDGTYYVVGDDRGLQRSTARIVAATNLDLEASIRAGRFRRDLLGRLRASSPPVVLPPLRERPEDLLEWIPRLSSRPLTWSAGFAEVLLTHEWLRNLRELSEVVNGAARRAAGEPLKREHLELHMFSTPAAQGDARERPEVPPGTPRADPSRDELEATLEAHAGNVKRTAAALGVERTRIYRLCRELGIDLKRVRGREEEER